MRKLTTFFLLIFLLANCAKDTKDQSANSTSSVSDVKLFKVVPATQSNITFSNNIKEDQQKNYFNFEYIYQGGGVALGDINNDGLIDIYFTGNQVANKLYLNKGNLKFEDITKSAGVVGKSGWFTGVNMVDINNDGLLDIYVCKGGYHRNPELRKNELYINKGNLKFVESAAQYGLAESGHSIQSTFLDYDNDGDLDVYITNHPIQYNLPLPQRLEKRKNPDDASRDKLYQNNGNKFTEVSKSAGIVNYGHGLGIVAADINDDNFIDLYIANDYKEPDYLYINNGNGTFTDKVKEWTGHVSHSSMGVDIADINNDGLEDILVTEMLPEDYKRSKTNMASMDPKTFNGMIGLGLHHQYMHNTLQLNRGQYFSEIAQLLGISKTDWSWSCLMSDFDNDGLRDVFIANGFKRDVFDKDYKKRANQEAAKKGGSMTLDDVYRIMPATKLANYIFKNEGDLHLSNKTNTWGLDKKTLSQGAACADLDNDGDLDLVVNNMDELSFIYENNANKIGNHYLTVKLNGPKSNKNGIGAKVRITTNGTQQFHQLKSARGYQSASQNLVHFGLGNNSKIDEVRVDWPDETVTFVSNVKADQKLVVSHKDGSKIIEEKEIITPLFVEATDQIQPAFQHQENNYDDYQKQILLPHEFSRLGPFISVGDINGDQLEDFFVGGASGQAGTVYLQNQAGQFSKKVNPKLEADQQYEDMGSTLFDLDRDGDLDLYVVSGGVDFGTDMQKYQDRLYLNDGKGNFSKTQLPKLHSSGSCVTPFDYDEDGDLDLFVGGRILPDQYPYPPKSYLLKNEKGKLVDVTNEVAPELNKLGMVTSAIVHNKALVVAGEWMGINSFNYDNGNLVNTDNNAFSNTVGWWNSLASLDENIIAGNLGLNYKFKTSKDKKFNVYCNDFDKNGSYDIVLTKYDGNNKVPIRGRECSSQQMPFISKKYPTYKSFADANVDDMIGENIKDALHYEADIFSSIMIEKNGTIKDLPQFAQFSTINGIVVDDYNKDGIKDLMIAGNRYRTEVETTRSDASIGLILLGKSDDSFESMTAEESGVFLPYDIKDLKSIKIGDKVGVLASENNGRLRLLIQE